MREAEVCHRCGHVAYAAPFVHDCVESLRQRIVRLEARGDAREGLASVIREQHHREALESAAKMLESGKHDYQLAKGDRSLSDAWMDAAHAVRTHKVTP